MPGTTISHLSDRELLSRLQVLSRRERSITLDILTHLNEVEHRRLHIKQGFSSMFDYCTRRLRYSASSAARRIRTARCIRRYPVVASLIEKGDVNLSTVSLIASVLDDRNAKVLIERIRHMSQREVESIVAEYRAPVRLCDRVRPVRVRVTRAAASAADENHTLMSDYCRSGSDSAVASGATPAEVRDEPAVGSKELVAKSPAIATEKKLWIQFLASEAFMKKYEEVRALLGNRVAADASFEDTFAIVMDGFIERHSPRRKLARREARLRRKGNGGAEAKVAEREVVNEQEKPRGRSRHIPAQARDAVFARDNGQCTFVGAGGTRCGARRYLHVDHVTPFCRGGRHHPSNLRLLCSAHNQSEAERLLGPGTTHRFRRRE